jgi:hypothetical protein
MKNLSSSILFIATDERVVEVRKAGVKEIL